MTPCGEWYQRHPFKFLDELLHRIFHFFLMINFIDENKNVFSRRYNFFIVLNLNNTHKMLKIRCCNKAAHHHQVWCSEQILGSILRFWTSLPTPSLQAGPVYLGTRWQKWSAATWGRRETEIRSHWNIKLFPSVKRQSSVSQNKP